MGVKSPDQVDVEVGQRIRVLRNDAGISQTVLAEELGVTFLKSDEFSSVFLRHLPFGDGRQPIAL